MTRVETIRGTWYTFYILLGQYYFLSVINQMHVTHMPRSLRILRIRRIDMGIEGYMGERLFSTFYVE